MWQDVIAPDPTWFEASGLTTPFDQAIFDELIFDTGPPSWVVNAEPGDRWVEAVAATGGWNEVGTPGDGWV